MAMPPSVLHVGPPFLSRPSTKSDGALTFVDAASRFASSEPGVMDICS